MRRFALALLLSTAFAAPASAQEFSLRLGADVNSIVTFPNVGDPITIGDAGTIGINIVPGLRLAKILTLEVGFAPRIPLGASKFDFNIAPGVFVDLFLLYVHGNVVIGFSPTTTTTLNVGAGLSFLGSGYFGVTLNYLLGDASALGIGAEVGWRLDFGWLGGGSGKDSTQSTPSDGSGGSSGGNQGSTPPAGQPAQPEESTITP